MDCSRVFEQLECAAGLLIARQIRLPGSSVTALAYQGRCDYTKAVLLLLVAFKRA